MLNLLYEINVFSYVKLLEYFENSGVSYTVFICTDLS